MSGNFPGRGELGIQSTDFAIGDGSESREALVAMQQQQANKEIAINKARADFESKAKETQQQSIEAFKQRTLQRLDVLIQEYESLTGKPVSGFYKEGPLRDAIGLRIAGADLKTLSPIAQQTSERLLKQLELDLETEVQKNQKEYEQLAPEELLAQPIPGEASPIRRRAYFKTLQKHLGQAETQILEELKAPVSGGAVQVAPNGDFFRFWALKNITTDEVQPFDEVYKLFHADKVGSISIEKTIPIVPAQATAFKFSQMIETPLFMGYQTEDGTIHQVNS